MKPFKLTVAGRKDLKDIAIHTQQKWNKEQRNIYLKQFDDAFHLLGKRPKIGKGCDELREGYRKFPQGRHVIYYKPELKQILIVRVLHKNMDVKPVTFGA